MSTYGPPPYSSISDVVKFLYDKTHYARFFGYKILLVSLRLLQDLFVFFAGFLQSLFRLPCLDTQ